MIISVPLSRTFDRRLNNDFRLDEPAKIATLRNLFTHFAVHEPNGGFTQWRDRLVEREGDDPVFYTDVKELFDGEPQRYLSEETLRKIEGADELTFGDIFMVLHDLARE